MIKTKQDKIRAIKRQFQKHKVLRIEDLFKVIGIFLKRIQVETRHNLAHLLQI